MTWGQGARMALPIYGYYMQKAYADSKLNLSREDFTIPEEYNPEEYKCDKTDNSDDGDIRGGEPDF
jgi:penicillin-binding protein 1A